MPNRFTPLRISFTAMKNKGFTRFLPRRIMPFFLYLSPVAPLRIASTGVNFLTLRVLIQQNSRISATTASAQPKHYLCSIGQHFSLAVITTERIRRPFARIRSSACSAARRPVVRAVR